MAMLALGLLVPPAMAMYVLVVALVLDMDRTYAQYALVLPVAYVLGSIPWGFLIAMGVRGVDIRQYGSGRTGTSNVLRSAGGKLAVGKLYVMPLQFSVPQREPGTAMPWLGTDQR